MSEEDRPIAVAVSSRLVEELKIRKDTIEKETGRKAKGGITAFSELAALELKAVRMSGDKIVKEILKLKDVPVKKIIDKGVEREFVPYEIFKKIYIFSSALNHKKDQTPMRIEVTKLRGLKKNEIKCFW